MTAPIPTFRDGVPVTPADLNNLVTNTQVLYGLALAGIRTRPPMVQALKTTTQTVANETFVLLSWQAAEYDTDGMFTAGATVLTCKTAGVYRVGFHAHLAPQAVSGPAIFTCRMTRNSAVATSGVITATTAPLANQFGAAGSCSDHLRLEVNDVLRCFVRQDAGSSTSTLLTFGGTRAWAHWIAP